MPRSAIEPQSPINPQSAIRIPQCLAAFGLTALLVSCAGSAGRTPPSGSLVDLSHDYSADTVFWPTAEPFKLEKVADGMTPQGYYYAANNFATSEHGGTHLDAPVHFA